MKSKIQNRRELNIFSESIELSPIVSYRLVAL